MGFVLFEPVGHREDLSHIENKWRFAALTNSLEAVPLQDSAGFFTGENPELTNRYLNLSNEDFSLSPTLNFHAIGGLEEKS